MFALAHERITNVSEENVFLYLIVRKLKSGTRPRAKVVQRYDFDVRQIDIDDEIRKHLRTLTLEILQKYINKGLEIHEYSPITDSSQKIFTYSMESNAISFSSVVNKQLAGEIPQVHNFGEIVAKEDLWAYCVAFFDAQANKWVYTFKKVYPGQAAVDENARGQRGWIATKLRTVFNSDNDKLEVLKGDTFILEKNIDCFYLDSKFLVISKPAFEEIVDLKVEQEKQARLCLEELKGLGTIEGIEVIEDILEGRPTLHKKLIKMQASGNYKAITKENLERMKEVAKEFGLEVKQKNGKLLIENLSDVETVVKLLAEYYKEGLVFGKKYGTYAGMELS